MPLETRNLDLQNFTPRHFLTLIEEPHRFQERAGFPAADGLREFLTSGEVSPDWLAKLREAREPDLWRDGFAVVHREAQTIIGVASYKGGPDAAGMVEIAYGIVPAFEGRGYATECAEALTTHAWTNDAVKIVRAHTLAVPNASTRVLAKCGFVFLGEVIEPEDGLVWRWEFMR